MLTGASRRLDAGGTAGGRKARRSPQISFDCESAIGRIEGDPATAARCGKNHQGDPMRIFSTDRTPVFLSPARRPGLLAALLALPLLTAPAGAEPTKAKPEEVGL